MRLNIGCGSYPLHDYTNIDLFPPADIMGDFTTMTFHGVESIRMSHVLEHLPWRETNLILRRLRSWLAPGGSLVIEVPDMQALMALGTHYAAWRQWIFGEQGHEGEYHKAGFTPVTLRVGLEAAGFQVQSVRAFLSDHPARVGYPCVEATGVAP